MTSHPAQQFEFRPYQRPFARPLTTSHGTWAVREGIILRLIDQTGQISWGEIAPIPWFGSETLKQAHDFCQQLPRQITATDVYSIPSQLPACQFGFESAWEGQGEMNCLASTAVPLTYSYLLPTGEKALTSWQAAWDQGYRTFKWKIGVASVEDELNLFKRLIQVLPTDTRLRLDANGGLTQEVANQWLQVSDGAGVVEFLEQPLPPSQFKTMLEMSHGYSTAIALDESVATLAQLELFYQRGWRGVFVVKPSIAGSPRRLRQFCQAHDIDTVFSSVFETAIARQAALRLTSELSRHRRAVGFGINHWFNENDETWLEQLWKDYSLT